MPIDAPVLLKVIDSVLSWFSVIRKDKRERDERELRAIKALSTAVTETMLYFRRLDRPHLARSKKEKLKFKRNIEAEENLSRLWRDASVQLHDINSDLAKRCFFKAQYWADRDAWSEDDVKGANIKLQEVIKEARELIGR